MQRRASHTQRAAIREAPGGTVYDLFVGATNIKCERAEPGRRRPRGARIGRGVWDTPLWPLGPVWDKQPQRGTKTDLCILLNMHDQASVDHVCVSLGTARRGSSRRPGVFLTGCAIGCMMYLAMLRRVARET